MRLQESEKADRERDDEAFSRALGLLAVRARSRHELRERLLRSSFTPEAVDAVERRLLDVGLLDDLGFAKDHIRSSLAAGKSRVWMGRDLRRRGVDEVVIQEALKSAEGEPGDYERALELARRRAGRLTNAPQATAYSRIARYLCQRGYDLDVAVEVSDRALNEGSGRHDD